MLAGGEGSMGWISVALVASHHTLSFVPIGDNLTDLCQQKASIHLSRRMEPCYRAAKEESNFFFLLTSPNLVLSTMQVSLG